MQTPKKVSYGRNKEIFRYVKGTLSYGIRYTHRKPLELVGYNDSSHNIDHDVGRSTIGHVFYLKRSSLTWCSQKQETVAFSS